MRLINVPFHMCFGVGLGIGQWVNGVLSMTKVLLAAIQELNNLKGQRWSLSEQEKDMALSIQDLILQQAELDTRIYAWEKYIKNLRRLCNENTADIIAGYWPRQRTIGK